MAKKEIESLTFIGRPFPYTMMDDQKTFGKVNMQMENDEDFQKFLQENGFEKQRSSMFVFGPESFMYWYGIVTNKDIETPKSMMKYVLPKGEIAEEESDAQLNYFSLPAHYLVETFFKKLMKENISVFQNPGDSDTPYLVQDLNLDSKKLKQFWYLSAK